MSKYNWMPILKTGTFTAKNGKQVTFNENDLDKIVSNTDLSKEPQFVIEHPSFDKLGFGTIESLKRFGNYLFALPKKVDEKFKEIVNSGVLPGRSVSINDSNFALNHIGFLPKEIEPAVDGLGDYSFSTESNEQGVPGMKLQLSLPGLESHFADIEKDKIEFAQMEVSKWTFTNIKNLFRNLKNKWIEKFGTEEADQVFPEWDLEQTGSAPVIIEKNESSVSTNSFSQNKNDGDKMDFSKIDLSKLPADIQAALKSAFANMETDLNNAKTELQAATTKLSAAELKDVRNEVLQFCESEEVKLKIKPADKEKVVNFLMSLKGKSAIELSSPDGTKTQLNAYEIAKEMIKNMPDVISLNEFATKQKVGDTDVSAEVKLGREIAGFVNPKKE